MPSPASSADFSPESSPDSHGIVMLSLPDSQDAVAQDVFHTPPEDSSLPSSDAAVDHCAVSHAVKVGSGSQGFLHLGRDSELGFSEVRLTHEIGVLGESPVKKSKLSEDGVGVRLERVEEGTGHCKGKVVSESDAGVSLCESEKVACTVEGEVSSDAVKEGSGMGEKSDKGLGLRMLPPSMRGRLEDATIEVECGSSVEKEKFSVFDVLKVISDISAEADEKDGGVQHCRLLEVAKDCGLTFPRPRWWPDNFKG
uniref:Uncharacterized protein n=1 Tax=Cajanus cajan TaxID=3821 RepID=A0A151S9Q3_CAJCA|nr:hypothetical protein KK1_026668 [Cajanus cajan]